MQAKWPVHGPIDDMILTKAEYVEDSVREFRLRLKQHMTPPKV